MIKGSLIYGGIAFFLSIFLFSCKAREKVEKVKIEHHSTKFLLNALTENEFKFNTFSGKTAVSFDDGKKITFKAHLRIKKDSAIWVSITYYSVEAMRLLITKDTVKFMNKNNSTYFIGGFDYINKVFNLDLDYQMLEALLVGNSIDFVNDDRIRSSSDRKKNAYYISTVKKRKVKKEIRKEKEKIKQQALVLLLTPKTYKINGFILKSPESDQGLTASYTNFQEMDNQLFSRNLQFDINAKKPISVGVEYLKTSKEKELTFPFKIPSKYEQID